MTFLDTGILVGALLEKHPEHAACLKALEESESAFTDAHALAVLRGHSYFGVTTQGSFAGPGLALATDHPRDVKC